MTATQPVTGGALWAKVAWWLSALPHAVLLLTILYFAVRGPVDARAWAFILVVPEMYLVPAVVLVTAVMMLFPRARRLGAGILAITVVGAVVVFVTGFAVSATTDGYSA